MEPREYRCYQQLSPLFCWPWVAHGVGELEDFFSSWMVCAGEAHSRALQIGQQLQPGHSWAGEGSGVERLSMCPSGGSTAVSQGRWSQYGLSGVLQLQELSVVWSCFRGCWGLCSHRLGPISSLLALMPRQPQASGILSCMLLGPPAGTREIGCQLDAPHSFASSVLPGAMEMAPGSSQEGGLDQGLLLCGGGCLPSPPQEGL